MLQNLLSGKRIEITFCGDGWHCYGYFCCSLFFILITCYFVGERQGAECVQLSLVPEWTYSKTWEQDLDAAVSKMRS